MSRAKISARTLRLGATWWMSSAKQSSAKPHGLGLPESAERHLMKATTKYSGVSVITMMAMSVLRSTPPEKLIELAKSAHVTAEKASKFNADHRATFPALGKVIAALKFHFNKEAQGNSLVSTMTFPEFYKMKTGGKPNNHAESCAKAYGAFVDNGLITEQDYDYNTADALEKSAAIVTKVAGDLTSKHIIDAAEILKTRPKDAIKRLLAIIEQIDGPKTIEADKAAEYLKLIFGSGHLELVLASTGAEIAHVKDSDMRDRISGHISVMIDTLHGEPARAKVPAAKPAAAEVLTHESWTKENCGDVDPEYFPQAVESVKAFCESNQRFPADRAELDNWLDAQEAESESAELAAEAAAS